VEKRGGEPTLLKSRGKEREAIRYRIAGVGEVRVVGGLEKKMGRKWWG